MLACPDTHQATRLLGGMPSCDCDEEPSAARRKQHDKMRPLSIDDLIMIQILLLSAMESESGHREKVGPDILIVVQIERKYKTEISQCILYT